VSSWTCWPPDGVAPSSGPADTVLIACMRSVALRRITPPPQEEAKWQYFSLIVLSMKSKLAYHKILPVGVSCGCASRVDTESTKVSASILSALFVMP
jgi:hypothetical protein